jgi:hypothetical protein
LTSVFHSFIVVSLTLTEYLNEQMTCSCKAA